MSINKELKQEYEKLSDSIVITKKLSDKQKRYVLQLLKQLRKMIYDFNSGYNEISSLPKYLNKAQTCEYLSVSKWTLDNLIKEKKIKYFKCGKVLRFKQKDLIEFLNCKKILLQKTSINYHTKHQVNTSEKLFSITEVCKILSICRSTFYKYSKNGLIVEKIGTRQIVVRQTNLEEYIQTKLPMKIVNL